MVGEMPSDMTTGVVAPAVAKPGDTSSNITFGGANDTTMQDSLNTQPQDNSRREQEQPSLILNQTDAELTQDPIVIKEDQPVEEEKQSPEEQMMNKQADSMTDEILGLLMKEMSMELGLMVNRNIQRNDQRGEQFREQGQGIKTDLFAIER